MVSLLYFVSFVTNCDFRKMKNDLFELTDIMCVIQGTNSQMNILFSDVNACQIFRFSVFSLLTFGDQHRTAEADGNVFGFGQERKVKGPNDKCQPRGGDAKGS